MDEIALYETLGRSVAARRKAIGKTQAEIASQLTLSRASLANIERGNQKVLLHQIYHIAKALELRDITDLIPLECFNFNDENAIESLEINSADSEFTDEQINQLERFFSKSVST
jgi:transcriptional regulator with XRE-family HTH domain